VVISILVSTTITKAQTDEIPEHLLEIERKVASAELSDDKMLVAYEWLMYEYYARDMGKVRFYFRQATAFSREKKPTAEQRFYARMGITFSVLNEKDSVAFYFDKAVQLLESNDDFYEHASVYGTIATHYGNHDEFENAINMYLKALDMNEKDKARQIVDKKNFSRNIEFEVKMLANMSMIHRNMLNHEKSLEVLLRAKQFIEENKDIDFSNFEYLIDGFIVQDYFYFKEYEKAAPFIKNYYETAVAKSDLVNISEGLRRLAELDLYYGNYSQALNNAKEALQTAEKTQVSWYIRFAEGLLARVYIYLKDYKTALYYTERQLSRINEDKYSELGNAYQNLALIYSGMGDVKNAIQYLEKFESEKSKVSDENMHKAIQEMQVKYDTAQKERIIERQQGENERQRIIIIAVVLLSVLSVIIVILYIKRNRILDQTNATKDKFFNIISHDLKNPAVSQRNALLTLAENATNWDTDAISDYAYKLHRSASRLVNLLYSLLDWAQVQAGRTSYQPEEFELTYMLQSDINIIKNMADGKGVILDVQMPETAFVTGDYNMLTTIVRNLLTNAVKFTAKGGTVTLNINETGGKCTVSVSDTGT
jgi:signal transduction histidine kinase